jgi:hypothetical protein
MAVLRVSPERVSWAAAVALAISGPVCAEDLDPTGQGGQYHAVVAPLRVQGDRGHFESATLWVPFLLPNDPALSNPQQSFLSGAVAQVVGPNLVGAVGTYQPNQSNTAAQRVVVAMGTTDAASASGASSDVRLRETSFGATICATLLPDARLLLAELFAPTQNNLAILPDVLGPAPATPAPPPQAPRKVFSTSAVGVSDFAETAINPPTPTVIGTVTFGAPAVAIDPLAPPGTPPPDDSDLLVAITLESAAASPTPEQVPACATGVAVFRGLDNDPVASGHGLVISGIALGDPGPDHVAFWPRAAAPIPFNPSGATIAHVRQSQPLIRAVQTPSGQSVVYVTHGIGFTGTIFTGGARRPLMLAVDTLRMTYASGDPIPENNTIIIEADLNTGVGSMHGRPLSDTLPAPAGYADHWNTQRFDKFVDQDAHGVVTRAGGLGRFDMNAKGQLVALRVHESNNFHQFEIRLYEPVWNSAGTRIAGFTLGALIASSGDLDNQGNPLFVSDLRTTVSNGGGVPFEIAVPCFSGLGIDDSGRVAFVGVMEKFETTADWDFNSATPPTVYLQNVTTGLFVWEPVTRSLHLIAKGGQHGDTLTDAFPGAGPALEESLALGAFGFGDEPDAFGRGALSDSGSLIAVSFRSGGNQFVNSINQELERNPAFTLDTFLDRGGVLFAPGALGVNERSVRGVLLTQLGPFIDDEPDPCCLGNADRVTPGAVGFDDITSVLANWGAVSASGDALGDADCNGVVDFADITAALTNWSSPCP